MVDGIQIDNAYNNCIIALQHKSTGKIEMRRVSDYTGANREVLVDRVFSSDVEADDIISISRLSYGGATGGGGTSGPRLGD